MTIRRQHRDADLALARFRISFTPRRGERLAVLLRDTREQALNAACELRAAGYLVDAYDTHTDTFIKEKSCST